MKLYEEQRIMEAIKKAAAEHRDIAEYIDAKGNKVQIKIAHISDEEICSPYDAQWFLFLVLISVD